MRRPSPAAPESRTRRQQRRPPDPAGFCAPGTTWLERLLPVTEGVSVRVVSYVPGSPDRGLPVVMVPGLASTMLTFRNILVELTRDHTVHYVETREKPSSVLGGVVEHGIEAMGADIAATVSTLRLEDSGYILLAASSSATAAIHSSGEFHPRPRCMVLFEPNAVFDYPRWSLHLIRVAPPLYRFIRPFAKWYLRTFRINMREDDAMYAINTRALDSADPWKLRDAILAISSYRVWDRLDSVKIPCVVVSASRDTFHRHGDIINIVSRLPVTACWDLETHARTHSAEFVDRLRDLEPRL